MNQALLKRAVVVVIFVGEESEGNGDLTSIHKWRHEVGVAERMVVLDSVISGVLVDEQFSVEKISKDG